MQAVRQQLKLRRRTSTEHLARKGSILEKYKLERVLGVGSFSVVKLAVDRATGEKFACKIINLADASSLSGVAATGEAMFDDVEREIATHAALSHPNVLRLVEYYRTDRKIFVIMELLTGGDLLDALSERGSFAEDDARELFRQLLEALKYMHGAGIVHRDIKLENLLLVREGDISRVKLADFGLSAQLQAKAPGQSGLSTVCGTPTYVAPEVLLSKSGNPYGPACDLWSAGVLLFNLLSGYPPFHESNLTQLFSSIRKGLKPYEFMKDPSWSLVSSEAKDLIAQLLVTDPTARKTAAEALQHPWITAGAA
mmetsp:Transcript_19575/g.49440  ORF Transcript_19575/g.49440 Transcript_19575/m.49440 type:complete len:311 (+) Transcript_19575:288-1220(+)|eukprot:jgi/Tetstr1/424495/TSEL_015023.t1